MASISRCEDLKNTLRHTLALLAIFVGHTSTVSETSISKPAMVIFLAGVNRSSLPL